MLRRLIRLSLAFTLILCGEVWALGLGEVRLDSALNEPLRAEIELLSATPEELDGLTVALASAETFERYGLDRPAYLQNISFEIVRSGGPTGNFVRLRSPSPMTEPFLTFLVEATWSRGRLLREYTVLLDPPTFAPPVAAQPPVQAPQRSVPTDSGRIERTPAPTPAPVAESRQPAPAPVRTAPATTTPDPVAPSQPSTSPPQPVADDTPFDTASGGDYTVARGETLWGIAMAMRPDSRLSMNQTMLAIYEANPGAFGGNINVLRAGASLRLPSAEEIYTIDRGSALAEVQRQHDSWGGTAGIVDTDTTPVVTDTTPSLQLVPPDEDPIGVGTGEDTDIGTEPMLSREDEIVDRIAEIESEEMPIEQSLIDIRNDELANLQRELAEIRGEPYIPPVDESVADVDDPFLDDELMDDEGIDDVVGTDEVPEGELFPTFDDVEGEDTVAGDTDTVRDPSTTISIPEPQPSLLDTILGYVTGIYGIIAGAVLLAIGFLVWFLRRDKGEDDESWGAPLDDDDLASATLSGTESLRAPSPDESIVVVEQESAAATLEPDTMEVPTPEMPAAAEVEDTDFGSLEDTFSSETAVNLDQSDPIAEADFHMAYGLYDQAADLINGALSVEPDRQDLLTKLCEIYFVWGNRDSFVDAAERLHGAVAGGESADWDKIVIMGQQIAADHELFAGAGVAGATKAVDLTFDASTDDTGALDMDFGTDDDGGADIIDLGAEPAATDDDAVDFLFDESATADDSSATADEETLDFSVTAEMPTVEQPSVDATLESPTIEQPSELPSFETDATAEIDLDDLGLDLDGLEETEIAGLDDLDETEVATLDDDGLDITGTNEALTDESVATGKNPAIDPNATGVQEAFDTSATGSPVALDLDDELSSTGEMRLAADETGQNPMMDPAEDASLLDATGKTQVLSDDFAVETFADEDTTSLGDDDATMLAPGVGSDDEEFDFAKTEALPPDAFTGGDLDATGELPAVASTDVDLDLDDLTAALQVSELGDTVEQMRDDATVEQPRPSLTVEETSITQALSPDDMSDDLSEARTMTEVGTKLDLARAYVDMGDPSGARSILEEVLDEGDEGQRQQAQQLLDTLPT